MHTGARCHLTLLIGFALLLTALGPGTASGAAASPAPDTLTLVIPLPKRAGAQDLSSGVIAYIGEDLNVWAVPAGGGEPQKLTDDAIVGENQYNPLVAYGDLRWSPDGAALYYVRWSDVGTALYRHDWLAQRSALLASLGPEVTSIVASPDGQYALVVYNTPAPSDCPAAETPCLSRLDIATGTLTELLCETCEGWWGLGSPVFSPDSTYALITASGFEYWSLVRYPLQGQSLEAVPMADYCSGPRFSPGGDVLWAACIDVWMQPPLLYTMNLATGRRLLRNRFDGLIGGLDVSPDGAQLAVSVDGEIRIISTTMTPIRVLARGDDPAWQPAIPGPSIDEYLARMSAALDRLESVRVTYFFVDFPVSAFEVASARDLNERISARSEASGLSAEQVDAFARLTVQAESLATVLELYSRTGSYLAEAAVDYVGLVASAAKKADGALSACVTPGNLLAPQCRFFRREVDRATLAALKAFGDLLFALSANPAEKDSYRAFWTLVMNAIRLELDAGASVQDLLLTTAVKGPVNQFLVRQFAARLQPYLEQGVRSADPDYAGAEPVWRVQGTLVAAGLQTEHLVNVSTVEQDLARFRHESFMRGANVAGMIGAVTDIAALTPLPLLARVPGFAIKCMHSFVDGAAIGLVVSTMNCLSQNAIGVGEYAFNPSQLVQPGACYGD